MKKILIVEDEQVLREAYVQILTMEGYDVYSAENGSAAIDKIKEVKPDLVLLDILMPVMDGLQFLQKVDVKKDFPDTIVVAFSNLSNQNKLEEMHNLGVKRHILKASMSPKELVAAVGEELAE